MQIMKINESIFTRMICDNLRANNALVIPFTASASSLPGVPDRFILHKSFSGFVEFKVFPNELSPAQVYLHKNFQSLGYIVPIIGYEPKEDRIMVFDYDLRVVHDLCFLSDFKGEGWSTNTNRLLIALKSVQDFDNNLLHYNKLRKH